MKALLSSEWWFQADPGWIDAWSSVSELLEYKCTMLRIMASNCFNPPPPPPPPPLSSDMTSRAYSPPLTLLLIGMRGAQCSPKAVHSLSLIRSVPRCKHTEDVPTGLSALVLSAEGWFKWICETAFPNQTKLNKGLRMHWVAFIKKSNLSLSLSLCLSLSLSLSVTQTV